MTALENLIRARDAAAQELADIRVKTATNNLAGGDMSGAGVNPNTNGPVSADHGEYCQRLERTIRELNKDIAALQGPTVSRHMAIPSGY